MSTTRIDIRVDVVQPLRIRRAPAFYEAKELLSLKRQGKAMFHQSATVAC